jgi:class 3 adenylate cyclase
MEAHKPDRRLAAIVAADVVGYSRLVEVDEAGTGSAVTMMVLSRFSMNSAAATRAVIWMARC